MQMALTILPNTVSFSHVRIMEQVTENGEHSGYFDQDIFRSWWNHQSVQGAGVLVEVNSENEVFDTAEMSGCCPELDYGGWSQGSIIWTIPCVWRESRGFVVSKGLLNFTTKEQSFSIDSQGTVQVEKFGCRAVRTPWGYANAIILQ